MLRVVVDTNIFVSAQLSRNGVPAQVLKAWREHRFIMLTSPAIIAEVAETLAGFIGSEPYDVSQWYPVLHGHRMWMKLLSC